MFLEKYPEGNIFPDKTNIMKKLEWMDDMRTMATLSVIVVHVIYGVVSQNYHRNMSYFWIGNIIDSGIRFCVPVFLMLSGASLLGKTTSYLDFIKRRFSRVLVPFIFWSIVYIFYALYMAPLKEKPNSIEAFWPWLSKLFWEKDICKHFWYLYTILVIYPFVPFIAKWLQRTNEKRVLIYLIIWAIYCTILSLLFLNMKFPYLISKTLNYIAYTGYLVLGYYLSKKDFSSIKWKYISISGFILTIIVTAISAYLHSESSQKLNLTLYGYYWIVPILQSICIFIIVKESNIKNKIVRKISETISNYSFGIYLVHVSILGFLYLARIYWTMAHPLISIPAVTLICLAISFSIIFLLRKIPGGSYISG